jgi:hypothetical protein
MTISPIHTAEPPQPSNTADRRHVAISERDAVAARVLLEAHDRFRHAGVSRDTLDRLVLEAVDEVWPGTVRITAFVPILALRRVGQKVRELEESDGVGP